MTRLLQFPLVAGLLVIGLSVTLLSACDSGSDDDSVDLVGTWERTFAFGPGGTANFHLTFNADGTWGLAAEGQPQGLNGTYTLSGRDLTIEDFFCTDGAGSYTVRIASGRLAFTTVEDPCFRVGIFTGSWGRVSAE